jgi:UDP-GlcNAc:undecaprenyl-phosphate GlcNAc-1-phosphate transferase
MRATAVEHRRMRDALIPAGAVVAAVMILIVALRIRGTTYAGPLHWSALVSVAFAVTFALVPLVERFAMRRGIVDIPSARKVHRSPTPLLGGMAVASGFAVTALLNFSFSRQLKGVLVGAAIVVALGVLDDVLDVPARWKLAAQIVAAVIAVLYGVVIRLVPGWLPGADGANAVLTVLWFLTVTNAIQFLDGMDGLAAGLGAIAALFFGVAALQTAQPYLMSLSASLAGACAGFLPYNFRRGGARIFLGDAGASFIGFTLAGLAAMGEWSADSPAVALTTPLLILAVPLFDIAFVGIGRVVTGKVASLGQWLAYTGKDHIHHRFEALGLTKAQSVLLIYFIALTLGISATVLGGGGVREAALVLLQAGCVLAIIAILERVGRQRQ